MIIIELRGGLGNQLFQYSFARSLAHELNTELFIDLSYFNHVRPNHVVYGLHSFNIKGVVGNYSNDEFTFMDLETNAHKTKINYYPNGEPLTTWGHYIEGKTNDGNIVKIPAYFDGYYQNCMGSDYRLLMSESFFKKNIDLIHKDLQYLIPLSTSSQAIVNDMNQYDSILLHVRHGDYDDFIDFGLCSKEYYQNAINVLSQKLDNPKFFIFSNDIEWTENNLKIEFPHRFIDFDNNKIDSVCRGNGELLKLMSSCKHFIIANSTLSWWAAFLSEFKEKIIITPEPWFQSRRVLGVDSIDNKKTISIENNYKDMFDSSSNSICNINNFSWENLKFIKSFDGYNIKDLKKNSKILLNDKFPIHEDSRFIIKISLKSNCFGALKIFFKTNDLDEYSDKNSLTLYYYENDDFTHYLLLPKNALLSDLMIKITGGWITDFSSLTFKSFEIKEISFNADK